MRFSAVPSTLALALLAALSATSAQASGYHFGSQSASAQGTANAGSAEAADASVVFYNPAGLTQVKGTQASGVLTVVVPSGKFVDQGSSTALGRPTGGGNGGKFVETTAVPHAYFSHQLSQRLTAGFGMFVPFGSKSEYDADWSGRYNTIGTELKTIALNPSLGFKVNESLSIGGGLTAQYIEGKLSKGADFGSGALSTLAPLLPPTALAALAPQVSGNPLYSGRVDVEGKDWGFGFNLGLMYHYNQNTRFGVAYRSKISHKLSGDAHWQVQSQAAGLETLFNTALPGSNAGTLVKTRLLAAYTNSDASLRVDTPESLSFSFFRQENKLALMGDITLTRHSRFQELRVDFANALPDSVTPQKWSDTLRASFGMSYQLNEQFKLRSGVAYDQTPTTALTRTPSIPDNDRLWLSAGLNWKLDSKNSLDFALSYVDINAATVRSYDNGGVVNAAGAQVCNAAANTSSCATVVGRYKLHSGLFGVQYNRQF